MLKYCFTHNNGKIEINKSLAFLSVSKLSFDLCLNLLNEFGVIKINNQDETEYTFEFLKSVALSEFVNFQKYEELNEELNRINSFREDFYSCDILQLKEMLS